MKKIVSFVIRDTIFVFWYVFCILLLLFPQPIPSALRGDPQKVRDEADTDRKEQGKETGAEEHHDSPTCSTGNDSTEESKETDSGEQQVAPV